MRLLNRNQKAAARQLSLAAYLLSSGDRARDERAILENLPPYGEIYAYSLGEDRDEDRASDALRKQLVRDVEAMGRAGIAVEVEGSADGRSYCLPKGNFSPSELDLTVEERSVLAGAVRVLGRDFPYSSPLRLALANLVGAATSQTGADGEGSAFAAAVATRDDEEVARRVGRIEEAVNRRKRVRFEYYSISRDATSEREVEPYAVSLLGGIWYVTGWDLGREAIRQFRVSRITGRVTFVTKKDSGDFEVPENFSRRFFGPRAPWQLGEPDKTARIRVSRQGMRQVRGPIRWAGTFGRDEHGMVFITRYSGERQLAGWVLSLGDDARALSPPSLVRRVEDGLRCLAKAHGGKPSEKAQP